MVSTQSVTTILCYLRDLAIETNAPCIVLTETWLTPDILDPEISIPGYSLYRAEILYRNIVLIIVRQTGHVDLL